MAAMTERRAVEAPVGVFDSGVGGPQRPRAYPGTAGQGLRLSGRHARLPYGTRSADSVLGVLEPGAVAACCARHTRGHRGDRDRKHRAGRRRRYRDPLRVTDGLFHVGSGVAIVDSAATTADAVRRALDAAELARAAPDTGTVRLLPTDGAERFARIGAKFLGRWPEASDIEIVDLATGTPILRS